MGEAWEAGRPPKLLFDWQPSLLNSFGIAPNLGLPNSITSSISNDMVMKNGTFPGNSALKVPQLQVGLVNEPCNWFHCLGPSQQPTLPIKSPIYNENLAALSKGLSKEAVAPLPCSGTQQKGFLVIDQSADKTTLVLCSGVGGPLQLLTSWSPQPTTAYKFNGEATGYKQDFIYDSKLVLSNDCAENHLTDEQSEMQEDTEELNALLYSEDESEFDEDDEDEVTSTGHSPSAMTTKDKRYALEEQNEEVASSAGSTKKRKIDGGYDVMSLMDTASSLMPRRSPEYEDDAESSCGNEGSQDVQDVDSSSINKRIRKEKIRETVGILESLIPGGKGKEAIVVLDEAIQYLKTLRLKAAAFGLNACC
ncbi:transcription factor bHLH143-like [Benincasa hispida]|uniref:transcription factor bHLH143-like n=1 Tax=Benincasa hispida TaxID=102211 RepID=UPI0019020E36|nr:transcription factor bHLH143-like [Benincasa hispida]XP_038884821.1 transcription factor bHLH143-like [Benincasa hispida]